MQFSRCNAVLLASAAYAILAAVGAEADETFNATSLFATKKVLVNWMKSINVGGPYQKLFQPKNKAKPGKYGLQDQEFLSGLDTLHSIISEAQSDGKRLRAFGTKYSSSNMIYTDEYLVDSAGLNYFKIGINDTSDLTAGYQSAKDLLVFVQPGVRIKYLNLVLAEAGLALPSSPATDGARFVGAVATGSHGSSLEVGGVENFVKGIHVVIPNNQHFFIQRATDQVVTSAYATMLGNATLISNDSMFNAALVSFGSFGLIHGMLFQAEPLYKLKMQSNRFNYNDVKQVLTTLDMSKLGFQGVTELPFHFEMTINAYRRNRGGTFVRVFQKVPLSTQEIQDVQESGQVPTGEMPMETDTFAVVESVLSSLGKPLLSIPRKIAYSVAMQRELQTFFGTEINKPVTNYPHEFFFGKTAAKPHTPSPVPLTSFELGLPADKVEEVVDIILAILDKDPIATAVAVRFNKPTTALMTHTIFGNYSATIELPGPGGKVAFHNSFRVHNKIYKALAAKRDTIPHAYHFGQNTPLDNAWVPATFGAALTEFQARRDELLGASGRAMFSNELMEKLGIQV